LTLFAILQSSMSRLYFTWLALSWLCCFSTTCVAVRNRATVSLRSDSEEHGQLQASNPFSRPAISCCCKLKPCIPGAVGVRGLLAVNHTTDDGQPMCCKERKSGFHKTCGDVGGYPVEADVAKCAPDEQLDGPPRVRSCRGEGFLNHHFIQFGDGGCVPHVLSDGSMSFPGSSSPEETASQYHEKDCPFPDSAVDETPRVRRALLANFHLNKPASWSDVMLSCANRHENRTGALDFSGSRWDFLRKVEPLTSYVANLAEVGDNNYNADVLHYDGQVAIQDFVCSTLRLLPVMWSRVGMAGAGLDEDPAPLSGPENSRPARFPRSIRGKVRSESGMPNYMCHHYTDFTGAQSLKGRRVLRAMLATYAKHIFASGDPKGPGAKMALGVVSTNSFSKQVEMSCDGQLDDLALARLPFDLLLNREVLKRDVETCDKTFPCQYEDPACKSFKGKRLENTCNCKCYTAVCVFFSGDFEDAMEAVDEVCQPVVFRVSGSSELRFNGAWFKTGKRNRQRPTFQRIGDKHARIAWSNKRGGWRMFYKRHGVIDKTVYLNTASGKGQVEKSGQEVAPWHWKVPVDGWEDYTRTGLDLPIVHITDDAVKFM